MSHILRVPGVPEQSRVLLKQLLAEDLIPAAALPHIVESYRRVIHDAYKRNGRANIVLGDKIADALLELLKSVNDKTSAKNLHIIQAAVRYFVIQDDGNVNDLACDRGLNDDAHLVNAVLRFFGRDDLMVDGIPETRPAQRPSRRAPFGRRRSHG